jgi:hypothetical protein
VGSYAVSVLIGFTLLERIYQILGMQSGASDILLTMARVVIIVAVQDIVTRLLWRLALKRTDTQTEDAELALYPPRWW